MIGSINEYAFPVRRFLSFSRTTGAYKLTYYNENNDVKHVCFTLNTSIPNGEEIIDKLNEIP